VNAAASKLYPESSYQLQHVVGIDTSSLFVARIGIRGSNDLVWVGRAANYAAKLSALESAYQTYITKDVYDKLNNEGRIGSDGRNMWESVGWETFDNRTIYRSNWWWEL
jgi:class 3 adenylate cyclase